MEAIIPILSSLFLALITYVGVMVTNFINKKTKELQAKSDNEAVDRCLGLVSDIVNTCVLVTNQTYVQSLKDKNIFDANAQRQALTQTKDAVMASLTQETVAILEKAVPDINAYINQLIEASVNKNK